MTQFDDENWRSNSFDMYFNAQNAVERVCCKKVGLFITVSDVAMLRTEGVLRGCIKSVVLRKREGRK